MSVQDTSLLMAYLKFGFFLGMTSPLWKKNTTRKRVLFNIYILLLFAVFTVTSITFYRKRLDLTDNIMILTQKVIDFLQMFTEFTFIATTLFNAIILERSWKIVLEKVYEIDSKLKTKVPKVSILYCLKGGIYFLIFLLFEIYEILVWENFKSGIELYYTTYRIIKFYQFFVLILIGETVNLLSRRYNYIECLITGTFARGVNVTYMKANLKQIRTLSILLSDVTQEVSKIFGKQIILILCTSIILILNLCNWIAIALAEDVKGVSKIAVLVSSGFLDPFGYIVVITITVLNCDLLEKAGQDIVKTCYLLQEHIDMEQPVLRGELILLSKFFRELAPKISACDYFFVNKKLLSGLLSSVTSYIIIIIQFRNN